MAHAVHAGLDETDVRGHTSYLDAVERNELICGAHPVSACDAPTLLLWPAGSKATAVDRFQR